MFALVSNGQVVRTVHGGSVEWNGFVYSCVELLTPAERKAAGIFDFISEPITDIEGKKAHGTNVVVGDGVVTESHVYVDKTREELDSEQATLFKTYEVALDNYLDSVAQQYRFKDRGSLSSRAAYPNQWQDLGIAFGTWMDSCNNVAYQGLQDVMDGKRTLPTIDEMLLELPTWVAP